MARCSSANDLACEGLVLKVGDEDLEDEKSQDGGANDFNDGAATPERCLRVPRVQRSPRVFEKVFAPVRLSSSGDASCGSIGGASSVRAPVRLSSSGETSCGSIGGTSSVRVDTRITAKAPTWCNRQSAAGARGTMQSRVRSPSHPVIRRISAPCGPMGMSGSTRCPLSPPAPSPRTCPLSPPAPSPRCSATSIPQAPNDGGTASCVKGDVSLYVRLRPGDSEDISVVTDGFNGVRLRPPQALRSDASEAIYRCDRTFGPEASQEDVYQGAVTPICDAVMRGYNGAVIAYGQTGSGKTHTMIGGARSKGIAPRAVAELFEALGKRPNGLVEVSVLEIYNEKVRDLLAPGGPSVTIVDVHEHCSNEQNVSFRCPEATTWTASNPEDALAALSEGMRRRETARTDMNHTSSRSHLIFTLAVTQSELDIGATLRGRLHIVDLAGSERLKRSMSSDKSFRNPSLTPRTPRDQRREAGEINKSLSQLALVIQRLTGPSQSSLQFIPYRDCMLTRLLAESFGGSSKTCVIITCSALSRDREETRCSLEFGKRAKLVKNKAEINLEVTHEPTPVMQAMVQKEIRELQLEKQAMLQERELLLAERVATQQKLGSTQELLKEAASEVVSHQSSRLEDLRQHEDEMAALQQRTLQTLTAAKEAQTELAGQLAELQNTRLTLHSRLSEAASEISCLKQAKVAMECHHEEEMASLRKHLADVTAMLAKQHEGSALIVEEASAATHQAEKHGEGIIAQSSQTLAGLDKRLEDALAETAESCHLRKTRLTDLEAQHLELKHKWRLAVEDATGSVECCDYVEDVTGSVDDITCSGGTTQKCDLSDVADPIESEAATREFGVAVLSLNESGAAILESVSSPCLPYRGESLKIGRLEEPLPGTNLPPSPSNKCASNGFFLDSDSPGVSNKFLESDSSTVSVTAKESGSSAEPFPVSLFGKQHELVN